jgi:hypothetical protein
MYPNPENLADPQFWEVVRVAIRRRTPLPPALITDACRRVPELAALREARDRIASMHEGPAADVPERVLSAVQEKEAEWMELARGVAMRRISVGYCWQSPEAEGAGGHLVVADDEAAAAHAVRKLGELPWEPREVTYWVHARVARVGDRGEADPETMFTVSISVDPEPPACSGGAAHHAWWSPGRENTQDRKRPGYFTGGGRDEIHRGCMKCGMRWVADLAAIDPVTGETGLLANSYDAGYYDVAALSR